MVVLPKHPHSSENGIQEGIQEGDRGILSPSLTQAYNYKPQTTALLLELEPLEGKEQGNWEHMLHVPVPRYLPQGHNRTLPDRTKQD